MNTNSKLSMLSVYRDFWLLLLLIMVNIHLSTDAMANVVVHHQQHITLTPYIVSFEDPNQSITLTDILNDTAQNPFATAIPGQTNHKHSQSAFWFQWSLNYSHTQPQEYLLEIANPILDEIDIYLVASGSKKIQASYHLGRNKPYHQRIINHRHFLIPILLNPKDQLDFYINVRSASEIKMPVSLWKKPAFYAYDNTIILAYGIAFGILMILFIYNLFIYFSLKDKSYLLFCLFLVTTGLIQGTLNGFTFAYLWPHNIEFNNLAVAILRCLLALITAAFTINFLALKKSWVYQCFNLLSIIAFISLIVLASSFSNTTLSERQTLFIKLIYAQIAASIAFLLLSLGSSIYLWRKKHQRSALFYTIAFSPVFIGVVLLAANRLPILSGVLSVEYNIGIIVSISCSALLSFALADRINHIKQQLENNHTKLSISQKNLNQLFANAPVMLLTCNQSGKITDVNDILLKRLNFSKLELINQPLDTILTQQPIIEDKNTDQNARNLKTGGFETLYQDRDKNSIPVLLSFARLYDLEENEPIIVFAAHDITALRSTEKEKSQIQSQLEHNQRLETIGTFAGGIAHDMNNMLTPIIGFSELMLMELDDKHRYYRMMNQILQASSRGQELVKQILTFSRSSADNEEVASFNPGAIINDNLDFLRVLLPKHVTLTLENHLTKELISMRQSAFHQIIINLCTNAGQAIDSKKKGMINITLDAIELAASNSQQNISYPGHYIKISVQDNGCGMNKTQLDQIFTPFYTTKEKGKGTGLGLSILRKLVLQNRGNIDVESTESLGTTFTLWFPIITHKNSTDTPQKIRPQTNTTTGSLGHILYVDDELPIVMLMQSQLKTLGFTVTALTSSREALNKILTQPKAYDLLISDHTMPELSGSALALAIRREGINVPIIFLSGDSELINNPLLKRINKLAYITKPAKLIDLKTSIEKILNIEPKPNSV